MLTVVFLTVNTATAAAADGDGGASGGGLLAPLNVTTAEGAPLDGYELGADGGSVVNVAGQTRALLLGGLFTLARLMVGLACWLVEFAFSFPLITALLRPAQQAADAYATHVVAALGLKGLLLGWAFVFGLVLLVRGRVGKGLGEIVLTLLIAAFAASAFIRPDYLLGAGGPLDQTHQAALEVAEVTTSSYFDTPTSAGACDRLQGPGHDFCDPADAKAVQVAQPIQDALTNALVVKPYMLLQYGQVLDPKTADDKAAYKAHLKWVSGGYEPKQDQGDKDCGGLAGLAEKLCQDDDGSDGGGLLDEVVGPDQDKFDRFADDLGTAGKVGEDAAAYATSPTWDRVGAALLLLVAVAVIALLVCSMGLVLLGCQGADVGAAAVGGIAWVWGMLPGPNRMAVWRWLGVFVVSVMVMFTAAMFLPLFGIAVDALLIDGPDLMVERLLLLDALAIAGLAFHRRLLASTAQFGQRMAMRMRYAKVGGTHLPGDTSELGAALAMHGNLATGGGPYGLLGFGGPGGGSGAHAALSARHKTLGHLTALTDGAGMPFDPGRLLGDALAEGRRGFAPAGLALRAAHALLIGARPEDEALDRLRKPVGGSDDGFTSGDEDTSGDPVDRMAVNKRTGEILHDPSTHRPLLGTRVHNRAVRLRGYRIAHRTGRLAYDATLGLPSTVQARRRAASEYTQDAATQLQVAANQVREDAGQWAPVGRAATATVRTAHRGVTHASQRAATFLQVHDPVTAARDAAAGAALFTAPSTVPDPGPRPGTGAARPEEADVVNRRRVFDALMRAQRSTWQTPPTWGGDES